MKNALLLCLTVFLFASSCSHSKNDPAAEEWMTLFNKKDLSGWDIKIAKHDLNDNFNRTFYVEDSILKVDYSGYQEFNGEFGHLYYKDPFSYYKLRVEYRFVGEQLKGGPDYAWLNSGIMLHSQSAASNGKDQSFPVSLEFQLLSGDKDHNRPTGNLCTPGTEVSMNGNPVHDHCVNSSSKTFPVDEWVNAEAVVYGDSIIHHIINGDTVLTYGQTRIGGGFVNSNLTWSNGGFGADSLLWIQKQDSPLKEGYIALQAESHPVQFRKIELLNLVGCMDKNAINYKSYFVKDDRSKCRY